MSSQRSASELQIYFLNDAQERANSRRSIVSNVPGQSGAHPANHSDPQPALQNGPGLHAKQSDRRTKMRVLVANPNQSNGEHAGRYNLPVSNDIAVLMPDDEPVVRDIVLRRCYHDYISGLNQMYDSLQFPLLFPFDS